MVTISRKSAELTRVPNYFCALMKESRKRHIWKAISWRVIASISTFLLTLLFFKEDPNATEKALHVALLESVFKMVLYYYHERVWFINQSKLKDAVRHLAKTITWRAIATATTFAIALFIFKEDDFALEKASGIALVETFLKMLLYYVHERIWFKQDLGLSERKKNS